VPTLLNETKQTVLCARCDVAETALKRLLGLVGRDGLAPDEGMLFRRAGSIHTFFMRFAIDVVFCDRDLTVLKVVPNLQPWKTAGQRGAKVTIELAAGAAAGVATGDRLVLQVVPPAEEVGEPVP
jgi:uncharacterized membrane protein (UPF0127 family)